MTRASSFCGAGQAMTLRLTSPHAPRVEMRAAFIPCDGRPQVLLDDPVELDALPGGEAQGAVGPLAGDVVEGEVLPAVIFPPGSLRRTMNM